MENIQKRAWGLADLLRDQLGEIKGARLRDAGAEQCAIVSFTIDGLAPWQTVTDLRVMGINIGASDPESTRLDSESRNLPVVLRAAPHYYNTEAEITQMVAALKGLM